MGRLLVQVPTSAIGHAVVLAAGALTALAPFGGDMAGLFQPRQQGVESPPFDPAQSGLGQLLRNLVAVPFASGHRGQNAQIQDTAQPLGSSIVLHVVYSNTI